MSTDKSLNRNNNNTYDVVCLCVGTILIMLRSMRILYVRGIGEGIIYGIGFVCFLIYAFVNYRKLANFNLFSLTIMMLLLVIYVYDRLRLSAFTLISNFCMLTILLGAIILIQCRLEDKLKVYRAYCVTIQIMVGLGLVWWILYLIGVPLPYKVDNSDSFYFYQVYTFFNVVLNRDTFDILPRYAGPFLEPGHLGSMCIYLLYINGFNLKKIGNIVLLLGVLFSLSLAAYGLLVGAALLTLFSKRKYISIIVAIVFFILVGIGSQLLNNGDNPVYQLVVSRLELNENGDDIVGNNRTTGFFDLTYAKFLKSNDVWTGVGRRAFGSQKDGSDNVTMGTAGYKRYFYLRGIVGTVLICVLLLLYTLRYSSRMTIGYLIIYVVANLIRDYPTKEIWMYLFLMAVPLMYYYRYNINYIGREDNDDEEEDDITEVPLHQIEE